MAETTSAVAGMKPTYSGEVQFRRYSDTSSQGQSVTFSLASREDLESFIGMEGKRFAAVFVLLGDDEMPVEPPEAKQPVGELCKWAAIRCGEPAFIAWIESAYPSLWADFWQAGDDTGQAAANVVRALCGVASRRELDTNEGAAALLHKHIRLPYAAWLKKR